MQQKVMAAVRELGYQPDLLAQSLRSRKTWSIGFSLSDIANPVFAHMVTGAESRLREDGYSLLLTNSDHNPRLDISNIRLLGQRRVDGLIIAVSREDRFRANQLLKDVGVPIVFLDRDIPSGLSASVVLFDHRRGMKDAAEYLVTLGHKNVGLITGGPRRPARERRAGVEQGLKKQGKNGSNRLQVLDGDFTVEYGTQAMRRFLTMRPPPTAIIAGGNLLMHGALKVLHEQGLKVGRDVSFVGCDDVAIAELHDPQIAVVRRDLRSAGVAAAELMLAVLRGDSQPRQIVLPTEFVPRPSCAPPV